ncbi:CST complex subunit TEN1 [Varanus komodoensis]|uniref:CST complex subunit TEN1 n=1 Tax=Varanus komodoensis TaxID=61221 RepID=A0A8D2Q7F2_VARKO|nr:CST complex subunit TEN1 [Varanus komodoensis]XP_044309980.1 CST complex subunit TEN1 [Varanus komodoensis]XP_044309982.1 CST complex subunit TEN1 [Varanus komodoensis]XP_044309983.1 CST complex subunit TEN1 [Varanus komodoensis]XP_044309984.1 CST complex subunit TEN1 [Varanus komodoensis]XP_044309985.1 CST complex subunit TEN1 [Varanus komodoensis]KAF7248962.1 CST complex subunit TEN1 [Varanus komodoensis]
MLPAAGIYHFPWEINSASVSEGKTLRTFGRLQSYDMVSSQAILTSQHASVQHCIRVCTKFVEPFQAQLGSLYVALGEAEFEEGEAMVLKARVFTCVEGMNLQLLEKAIEEQRKYFQERKKNPEGSNS